MPMLKTIILSTILVFAASISYAADIACLKKDTDYSRWKSNVIADKLNPDVIVIDIGADNTATLNHFTQGTVITHEQDGLTKIKFDYATLDAAKTKMVFQNNKNDSATISWEFGQISDADSVGISRYQCGVALAPYLQFSETMNDQELCQGFFLLPYLSADENNIRLASALSGLMQARWGKNWRNVQVGHCQNLIVGKPLTVVNNNKPQ